MRRRWQSCPSLLIGNQGGKALKWLPAHFNFERKNRLLSRERVHKFGTFCPKVRRGTRDGAFIYALSADETSPAFAALRNAITALFFCRFKCHCPPQRQRYFHGNADRAYNTLHFASKVVCQRVPYGNLVLSECVAILPPKRKISGFNLLLKLQPDWPLILFLRFRFLYSFHEWFL